MSLFNWIYDIYQHTQIDELRQEVERTRRDAARIRKGQSGSIDVQRLEQAIGELALCIKTLQRVVLEKGLCTPSELQQKMQQIDVEDGHADGRTTV